MNGHSNPDPQELPHHNIWDLGRIKETEKINQLNQEER